MSSKKIGIYISQSYGIQQFNFEPYEFWFISNHLFNPKSDPDIAKKWNRFPRNVGNRIAPLGIRPYDYVSSFAATMNFSRYIFNS